MKTEDFQAFSREFGAAWEFHRPLNADALALAFRTLAAYPLDTVLAGIDAHMRDPERGRFGPKPGDIVYQIERFSPEYQCLSADEAWALCPRSERHTAVWTEEMAEAYRAALPLLHAGDETGARMAFRGAYERIVARAKAEHRPVRWVVSEGWDEAERRVAVEEAVRAGRLPGAVAARYLPLPGEIGFSELISRAGQALLEHEAASVSTEKAIKNLRMLRGLLDAATAHEQGDTDAKREADMARKREAYAARAAREESLNG